MKKALNLFTMIAFAIFIHEKLHSQSNFSVHLGSSIPVSDFGNDDLWNESSGLAASGIHLGCEYSYPLKPKGFNLFVGSDFNYNGIKKSVKNQIISEVSSNSQDYHIKFFKYINIPIITGIQYIFKSTNKISIFGTAGFGIDLLKITKFDIRVELEEGSITNKLSTALACKIGAGIIIKDKYLFGLNYNGLGNHKIQSVMKFTGEEDSRSNFSLRINLVDLSFGYRF